MLRSEYIDLINQTFSHSGVAGAKNLTKGPIQELLDKVIHICDDVHEDAYSDGYDEGYSAGYDAAY